jgi:hypothetical protein
MKTITTENKWFMALNIAGQEHGVLFDGDNVYDDVFINEKIENIPTGCGFAVNQEQLVKICQEKMKEMEIIKLPDYGEYVAVFKNAKLKKLTYNSK